MSQQSVEFASDDGTTLRGVLYLPDAADGVPGVVMSHGFSAVAEMGLPAFAKAICGAGCAVLVYDHRGLGASDGQPRQQINPWLQMSDMQVALGWLGECPEVDAGRLGLWGSSFSGGEVLILSAIDKRVRAVVATVPFVGAAEATNETGGAAVVGAIQAAITDGIFAKVSNESVVGPLAVVNEEGNGLPAFLGHPEAAEWFLSAGANTTWRNEVTLANAFGTEPPFDPGVCVGHLGCPALFVVASQDEVAEAGLALAAYGRAPEPKQLLVLDGHHFTPYTGEALDKSTAASASWFAEHL